MSKLRILNGPYRGREKTVADKSVTIGRDAEAGVQILDRSASRFHCEVFPVGGMFFVKDLDSKNGTYVNDERLTDEELLRVGDVIKIGTTELLFETGTALADESSSDRIAYNDDPDLLSNTLEFRIDELSDISEPTDSTPPKDGSKGLRILYQVGKLLTDPQQTGDREARVLDLLVQRMPSEAALIFRRDTGSGKLVPGLVRTSAPHIHPVISRSIVKKTFTENKALHSANAQDDERFDRHASIMSKGIRSVICVPLAVGGVTRGVVYLCRGSGQPAFDQFDLELVSACSIQIGLAQHADEERRHHRATLLQVLTTMIRALETRENRVGSGERCSRACVALAMGLRLNLESRERLRIAGLLHHFPMMTLAGVSTDSGFINATSKAETLLENINDLDGVWPLVRLARERLDGTGPLHLGDAELDVEARVLQACAAFEAKLVDEPGFGADGIIEALTANPGFDPQVMKLLHSCHLDGSLYGSSGV